MRRRVYLMRHADVAYFTPEGVPIKPTEATLTPEGERQAQAAGEALRGAPIDRVMTSGLLRTVRTAEIVTQGRGLSIEKKPALEEIHPGKLADIPANEAEKAFTRAFDPQDDPSCVRFLGGESLASLRDRVVPAWQQIVEDASWKTLLLVAHGGVNRVILAHALGAGFESWARMEQDAACINIVDVSVNPAPRYVVRTVNFTPYNAVKDGLFETTMERLFRQYKGRA